MNHILQFCLIVTLALPLSLVAVSDSVNIELQIGSGGNNSAGGGGSNREEVLVVSIEKIEPNSNSVVIRWESNELVSSAVRWGTTPKVDLGISESAKLGRNGQVEIAALEPDTTYWLEIVFSTRQGQVEEIVVPITTLPSIEINETKTPARDFRIQIKNDQVLLDWNMPARSVVRITRSTIFFPESYLDGQVIYEGDKESVIDQLTTLEPGTYYYTLYLRNRDGSYSSGTSQVLVVTESGQATPGFEQLSEFPRIAQRVDDLPTDGFVSLDFCEAAEADVRNCATSKVYEVTDAQQLVMVVDEKLPQSPQVATLIVSPRHLVNASSIYLMERDDDGRWKIRLPELPEGAYDYSIQFYTRLGKLLYQDTGIIRSLKAEELPVSAGAGEADTMTVFNMVYMAFMNLLLVGLAFYLGRRGR